LQSLCDLRRLDHHLLSCSLKVVLAAFRREHFDVLRDLNDLRLPSRLAIAKCFVQRVDIALDRCLE
jgi:hypothetical protein